VVSYLHSLNIVHRDLKAENILVTESKVTIIDFGFAEKIDPFEPLCMDRRGSAEYISPEIVMSTPCDPRKSDIWSLGVILFTLLTGSLPFLTPTTKKTFHKIARGDYSFPDPSKYPECAISLVKSLLVTSTENRPTAEWILSSDWLKE
jgi:serine/threonine protein kinase